MSVVIHVAAGVIVDDEQRILLALRPVDKHQGGLWEFPGGKVETGESVREALARELLEELNLQVQACEPLLVTEHDYGDRQVRLDVWLVTAFTGELSGREGQSIDWVTVSELTLRQFPAANHPIVEAVQQRLGLS